MREVAERIYSLFIELGYRWKIGGELALPTIEDIEKTLDKAKADLYAEGTPTAEEAVQLEVGNLIIRHHRPGIFDAYIRIGEINDSDRNL